VSAPYPPWAGLPAAQQAVAEGRYGVIVRLARTAEGLTLEEVGRRVGYSAATMSRIERGRQPLTDVTLLSRLAVELSIPPELLGLAPALDVSLQGKRLVLNTSVPVGTTRWVPSAMEGDDPLRRREFLSAFTFTAAAQVGSGLSGYREPAADRAGASLVGSLEDVLIRGKWPTGARPLDDRTLRNGLSAARADFQASRYRALSGRLPRLIAGIEMNNEPVDTSVAAEIYNTAAHALIKVESRSLDWLAIDRALRIARDAEDPAVNANVTRNLVTLYRRAGRYGDAERLALEAADTLSIGGVAPSASHVSLYGMLVCNAGYAAAQGGDRSRSIELLDHAAKVATRLGEGVNAYWTAFSPTNVTLHRISAAWALGDAGTAIDYAATVAPDAIQLPERKSRFWVDVARAWHQLGKFEECFRSLLVAEGLAPEEVRSRPAVRSLVETLLYAPRQSGMPGLRKFAIRVGALG
jgi:transcriptional regulator with XRE-family HTH domain